MGWTAKDSSCKVRERECRDCENSQKEVKDRSNQSDIHLVYNRCFYKDVEKYSLEAEKKEDLTILSKANAIRKTVVEKRQLAQSLESTIEQLEKEIKAPWTSLYAKLYYLQLEILFS